MGKYEAKEARPAWLALLTPARRRRLYQVATAAGALAVLYGLASPQEVAGWLVFAGAVLGTATSALAAANTGGDHGSR